MADQQQVPKVAEAMPTPMYAKLLANNVSFYTINRHNCLHFIVELGGLAAMHQIQQLQGRTNAQASSPQPDGAKSSPAWKEWQRTFDAIDDFVTILDLERRVLRTNKAIAEFFGIDSDALQGVHCHQLFWNKDKPCTGCPTDLVVQDRSMHCAEFESRRLGKAFMVSASPIFDDNDQLVGIVHVTRDITARKQAEDALKQAYEELEQRVAERTAELMRANAKLQQEIAERRQTEELLMHRSTELDAKSRTLEEANIALRVMLEAREVDRKELEERVVSNIKDLVMPYLKKLKKQRLNQEQGALIEIVGTNLNNVLSPFRQNLSSKYLDLTPREIQIADLVKDGKSSKEIAEILNTSLRTIEFHRENLRKKIGIQNRRANLRSHLLLL